MIRKHCFAVLLALAAIASAAAQTAELVKDIYPQTQGSGAFDFTPFGNRLLFFANDGVNGREPWITDGTTAGTHVLKNTLPNVTGFEDFSPVFWVGDGRAWFWGKDDFDAHAKLFVTDGSAAGTNLVDSVDSDPHYYFNQVWTAGDKLRFASKHPLEDTYTFFQSDGVVVSPTGLEESEVIGVPLLLDSIYYFRGKTMPNVPGYTADLMRSDGTLAGTTLIVEDLLNYTGSVIQGAHLWNIAGRLGYDLQKWIGPTVHHSLHIGGFPAITLAPGQQFGYNFTIVGDRLLYEAPSHPDSAFNPLALYAFDGSDTEKLTIYYDTVTTSPIASFDHSGAGKLLFRKYDPSGVQRKLWATDGTVSGTHVLIDLNTVPGISDEAELWQVYLNESLQEVYFHTQENDGKLCRFWSFHFADSTLEHLFDFSSVSAFGAIPVWTYLDGAIIFTADDGLIGRELWKYQLHAVGVEEAGDHKEMHVEVFPNPTGGILNLRTPETIPQALQWTLYDAWGRVVQTQPLDTPAGSAVINLIGCVPGIYYYRLVDRNGKRVKSGSISKI